MRLVLALTTALLALAARAEAQPVLHPGDVYEITLDRETSGQREGGTSSSTDRDMLVERVVAVHDDGVELEFDLPKNASPEDRVAEWQMPVRVFKPSQGPMRLVNGAELEARVDGWLKTVKFTRADCGHWIFTWNAFQIECDPQSALRIVGAFDLDPPDLREGASYRDPSASAPATVAKKGAAFAVEMTVDPDAVRREEAQADVVAGEITRKPVTLDEAMKARSAEQVSGTITVTFDMDARGAVQRRTKVSKVEIKGADGQLETNTVTETAERRLISQGASDR